MFWEGWPVIRLFFWGGGGGWLGLAIRWGISAVKQANFVIMSDHVRDHIRSVTEPASLKKKPMSPLLKIKNGIQLLVRYRILGDDQWAYLLSFHWKILEENLSPLLYQAVTFVVNLVKFQWFHKSTTILHWLNYKDGNSHDIPVWRRPKSNVKHLCLEWIKDCVKTK